ncbi:MAG: universal stress protein [Bacteroidia bacterium]|nr:universal stress protein [Bacteroidia bacterium]MCZ2277802.1 universal stress protein [Bacteroidia bacterium]
MNAQPSSIQKILIPFDFSDTAKLSLEHAVHMAQLNKAEILLLHVIESASFTTALVSAFSKSYEKESENEANLKLDELARKIKLEAGVEVKTMTTVGRIYKRIAVVAKETGINVIIMGTHGASGYQKFTIGTNTGKVVMEASCPVISVQTFATKIGFKKIVVPIDDSATSRQKVNHAVEMARLYGAHIHIIGLINFSNEDRIRKFKIKVTQVEEWLKSLEIGCDVNYKAGDNLAKMTMDYAEEVHADLVIIMTEQEPSITGLLMGTWATQVVNQSKIPVMSVRPDIVTGEIRAGY